MSECTGLLSLRKNVPFNREIYSLTPECDTLHLDEKKLN